jgi:hypothetical protein
MSFSEYDDCFVWECDRCGRSVHYPPGDFWGALADLKSRGWGIKRDGEGWTHYCAKHKPSVTQLLDRKPKVVGQ